MKNIKNLLYQTLLTQLDHKIIAAEQAIESAKESRDTNTKSSVGDKYETGRAMMQQELDKLETNLSQTLQLKQILTHISLEKKYNRAEQGSLVLTNQGNYFIAFGFGKLRVNASVYYVISLASPVGQLLRGKVIGDKVAFQGRDIVIEDIQ